MPKWEYRSLQVDVQPKGWNTGGDVNAVVVTEVLNRLGDDEWELVVGMESSVLADTARKVLLILKRPKAGE
jgi:hypothetical protein